MTEQQEMFFAEYREYRRLKSIFLRTKRARIKKKLLSRMEKNLEKYKKSRDTRHTKQYKKSLEQSKWLW